MLYIALGVLSFVLLYLFDYCKLKEKRVLSSILNIAGLLILTACIVMLFVLSLGIWQAIILRIIFLIFACLFLLLLFYSLFFELPFQSTYVKGQKTPLVTTGTYALCRHPGVLWMAGMLLCLFGACPSVEMLYATIIFNACNILYVYLQEKYIFPHVFEGYEAYCASIPFMIPTKQSIRQCLKNKPRSRHEI